MIDNISARMYELEMQRAAEAQSRQQTRQKPGTQSAESFGDIFRQELDKSAESGPTVEFSKHAISRAEERGIDITSELVDQIRASMIRARAKGVTNIVAMDAEKAFIINVPNSKVITAITHEEMKENVFTNIDGAVFL